MALNQRDRSLSLVKPTAPPLLHSALIAWLFSSYSSVPGFVTGKVRVVELCALS